MIPANEALNFIMVIIIKNGFQVDVEIGGYFTKMISHPAPEGPYRPQKRTYIGPKESTVYRAAFRQPGDSALGVVGGGSAPTPPNCRPKGLRNVGLWASPRLRLRIAVGKYYLLTIVSNDG